MRGQRSAACGLLMLWGCWGASADALCAEPDVLARPALRSERADQAVLLAVVRAGQRLVSAGEHGIIVFSDDNGRAWQQASVPVSVTLTSLHFASALKGWAVGHSGVVLHTEDGGKTWVKQLEGSDKPFLDVCFVDETKGFIVGAHGLFFATQDGGRAWLAWQQHLDNPKGKHLYAVRAADSGLYVAGEQGALYRSVDGGKTFTAIPTPYAGSYSVSCLWPTGE